MRFHPALQRVRLLLRAGGDRPGAVRSRRGRRVSPGGASVRRLPRHCTPPAPTRRWRRPVAEPRARLSLLAVRASAADLRAWRPSEPSRRSTSRTPRSILMECIVDGRPVPVHVSQDFVQRPPRRACQIVGDDGRIRARSSRPALEVFDGRRQLAERTHVRAASSGISCSWTS